MSILPTMTTIREALDFGWKRQQAGDLAGAESIYRQVLASAPEHADAWCYLGIVLYDRRRWEESVDAYREAVRLRPLFPIAWSNMGNSLAALDRTDEAESAILKAIAQQADYPTAWVNLGALQVKLGRLQASIESFERALALSPDSESAHRNLGAALVRQGRLDAGQRHSEAALRINPRSAEAHRNRAIIRLLNGDWDRGWPEFEWRWHCAEQSLPVTGRPLYDGRTLQGETVLLCAEQGLGDAIHFVRYAAHVRERGGRAIVEVPDSLVPVLRSFRHADAVVARGTPLPDFDYLLPMMSAPRVFGTRPDNVPNDVPYLFAEEERIARWRDRVPPAPLRVGIAWQGSRSHTGDRQRSVPLSLFRSIAATGAVLVCLQKGEGRDQIDASPIGHRFVDFGDALDADAPFLDTAALIGLLDLVITVDTSLAHLAGALGARVWTVLQPVPDWRWLLQREDTPWYPTMRLVRAAAEEDWRPVFDRMASDLALGPA
ncbi:MAG: tetratricopeptide repeat protein [Planctomycetes bacterium]|nr:tetratricopeptide repeat protein [Planctomycetota bacterium]